MVASVFSSGDGAERLQFSLFFVNNKKKTIIRIIINENVTSAQTSRCEDKHETSSVGKGTCFEYVEVAHVQGHRFIAFLWGNLVAFLLWGYAIPARSPKLW